jgi:site-specific DNA-methyltransferase (adenine-specific)
MLEINQVHHGDCLLLMKKIKDKSIDMILCDLPYGTTACSWDTIIPFEPLWKQYKRIIKDNGAIVLFGNQPFTSLLVTSNLKWFKYCWVWDKKIPSGMIYARFRPMQQTEDIVVFSNTTIKIYNPQITKRNKIMKSGGTMPSETAPIANKSKKFKKTYLYKNPTTLIEFDKIRRGSLHPTQKPEALCEYLIKTYTNEGELVLDNCAGSGTTGVACKKTGRNYILIEKEEKYVEIAKKRISETKRNHDIKKFLHFKKKEIK